MRANWQTWHATMPAIPGNATVSLEYSVKDIPQRRGTRTKSTAAESGSTVHHRP